MTGKILIVDDEDAGIATLEAILDGQGYELTSVRDGESALQAAQQILPDLVLLDVMMPGMDGFEVCRRLRAIPEVAEVPIIILTALDDYSSRINGLEAGADDFFSKPIDRQDLRARVRTITRLNRYRTLYEQRAQLREMAGRVVEAQEIERRRISRDLHDDLGQSLTALMLNLQNLQNELPLDEALLRQRLNSMLADTAGVLGKMRMMAQNLRPPLLEAVNLRSALETYCMDFSARIHTPLEFESDPHLPDVNEVYVVSLYRVLQETLTNIARHAKASRIWVELSLEGGYLSLTVQDNGVGFDPQQQSDGIGMIGLRERMTLIGGDLFVKSAPGRGTVVTARVPLTKREEV